MNIRGGNITIAEIMQNPGGRAIIKREFPRLIGTPMFRMAQNMTLSRVASHWGHHIGQAKVNALVEELKKA